MSDERPDVPQWGPPAPQHDGSPYGARWSEVDANGQRYMTAPARPGQEPPLWLPWYGAPFVRSVWRFAKKYARFDGRASRSEFWWAELGLYILEYVVQIPYMIGFFTLTFDPATTKTLDQTSESTNANPFPFFLAVFSASPLIAAGVIVILLWSLALIVPMLALGSRRLHDSNRRAWWLFLVLIPFFGTIVLLVFMCLESDPRGQRFDRPPRSGPAASGSGGSGSGPRGSVSGPAASGPEGSASGGSV